MRRRSRLLACGRWSIAAILALTVGGRGALAQTASPTDLKAAFLLNFAKFTEWPADALSPSAPLAFCVVDDSGLADALERMSRDLVIGSHRVAVRRPPPEDDLRTCQVLFAPDLAGARAASVLQSLQGAATLTVSDTRAFTRAGGIAHFYVSDDRMRFAINVRAAERARLQLSSRLLVLATIVEDDDR